MSKSDELPPQRDVMMSGESLPLGANRFDQHTATDQPVGPEPESPATAPPEVGG